MSLGKSAARRTHRLPRIAGRARALLLSYEVGYITPDGMVFGRGAGERMCLLCGCTALAPCPGGCAWVDRQRNLCTACLP
jgi:hypothetical protein